MKKYFFMIQLAIGLTISAADLVKHTPGSPLWDSIPHTEFTKWVEGGKPAIPTSAQITYDDNRLYFKIICTEPNLNEARQSMRYSKHDAPVWINECVEIFIANEQKTAGYYQFVVDIHNGSAELRHGDQAWPSPINWNSFWSHSVEYTTTSFTVYVSIPWKTVNIAPGKNQSVWVNISRMRKIHPWGRAVFSPKTPKQLHSKTAFIHYGNLNIAAPQATGTVKHSIPLAADNTVEYTLTNINKIRLDGKLDFLVTANNGSEEKLYSVPITLPPKKTLTGKFTYRMPHAGNYPARLVFTANGKTCDIWGDNLAYSVPLETGEDKPVAVTGKDHAILARIYIPFSEAILKINIADKNGKTVATKNIPVKNNVFFFNLPTAKLAAGDYRITIQLMQQHREYFTQTMPLLIVPDIF